jgi:hypothetical protein
MSSPFIAQFEYGPEVGVILFGPPILGYVFLIASNIGIWRGSASQFYGFAILSVWSGAPVLLCLHMINSDPWIETIIDAFWFPLSMILMAPSVGGVFLIFTVAVASLVSSYFGPSSRTPPAEYGSTLKQEPSRTRVFVFCTMLLIVSFLPLLMQGAEIVHLLVKSAPSPKEVKRMQARDLVESLWENAVGDGYDPEALRKLVELLDSKDYDERYYAIGRAPGLDYNSQTAIVPLCRALFDSDERIAYAAARSLCYLRGYAKDAIPELIRVMNEHPTKNRSQMAALALSNIAKPDDAEVRSHLEAVSQSTDPSLRDAAIKALNGLDERKDSKLKVPTDE